MAKYIESKLNLDGIAYDGPSFEVGYIAGEIAERDKHEELVSTLISDKFQSGNAIPVERITLTRAEVNEVFPGLLK